MSTERPWVRAASVVALAAACHAAFATALPSPAWADDSKAHSLIQRGSDLFDDQQYEESIQTLSAALLRPGTSKAEKIETYRLLAYNYITLKRTEEADAAVRGLLSLDESFHLKSSESPRFRDFFEATRKKWEAEGKPGKVDDSAARGDKPVTIQHASPAQVKPGTTVKLSGEIDDPDSRVRGVELNFRQGDEGKFLTVDAAYSMGAFRVQIPPSAVKPPFVEYYLQAIDKGGLPVAARGDAASPLRVVVPAPASGGVLSSPWFWVPVGVVVVGGAIATALILSSSKSTSSVTVGVHE
jgi:hypothetical protein